MDSNIFDLIRSRRTIGSFRSDVPAVEVVEAAIECASWAPTHKKTEPWRVYWLGPQTARAIIDLNANVIARKKGVAEAEAKRTAWSAIPGWLVVTCLRSEDAFREEEDYAACCCFVQNLMLVLWSREIGTKWSTGDVTREARFFELLAIDPSRERMVGMIWYGHPAVIPQQTRQPTSSFLKKLT